MASPRDLRRFVEFPRRVHAGDPSWVPSRRSDLLTRLDPARNAFYASARRELFLARRGGAVAGTVAAIIDDARNEVVGEATGYFGFFESIDDDDVARSLLRSAGDWLSAAGARTMRGPTNGSAADENGVLVEGFGTRPALWQGHHPRYYRDLLERAGLTAFDDELAYEMTYDDIGRSPDNLPDLLVRVAARARTSGATLRSPTEASWADDVAIAHGLYVRAHHTLAGHGGMPWKQFASIATALRRVIDLDLTLFVEVRGHPVGFAVAVPELNEALAAARGNVPLWTTLRLMRSIRRVRVSASSCSACCPRTATGV